MGIIGRADTGWSRGRRLPRALAGRRTPGWLFAVALVPSLLFLAFIAFQPYVPVEQAFRDTYLATVNARPEQLPSLLGVASNVGVLLWCGAAAVAFFAATLVAAQGGRTEGVLLLLATALYSGLMCADDLFMLHEHVYPRLLGVREHVVFAAYAGLILVILFRFRRLLAELGRALLLSALVAFGLSIAGDLAPGIDGDLQRWAEDGPKLVGIALWTTWTIRTAWQLCRAPAEAGG